MDIRHGQKWKHAKTRGHAITTKASPQSHFGRVLVYSLWTWVSLPRRKISKMLYFQHFVTYSCTLCGVGRGIAEDRRVQRPAAKQA